MGTPAVVLGDRISGMCATHMVPSPSGSPMPSPGPVAGKPAAVQGSSGVNTPPHVGLHPSDPFLAPPAQQGRVVAGSGTVFLNGRPAAYTGCQVTSCSGAPGQVAGSAATVLIGQ